MKNDKVSIKASEELSITSMLIAIRSQVFKVRVSYFIRDTGRGLMRERQLETGPPCISDTIGNEYSK